MVKERLEHGKTKTYRFRVENREEDYQISITKLKGVPLIKTGFSEDSVSKVSNSNFDGHKSLFGQSQKATLTSDQIRK